MRGEREQTVGILGLGPALSVDPEQARQIRVDDAFAEARLPAEPRRGHGDGAHRVSDVVLAITKTALAVFPGLAPVDRRESDQDTPRR